MADEFRNATLATDRSAHEAPVVRGASKRAEVRSAERLAAALAMIAGFVDAYGMITYGVYVSFMSGNTTQTGYQAAEGAFGPASLSALAILFFVVGSFAGTLMVEFAGRYARRVLYCVVAAALAAIVGLTQFGRCPAPRDRGDKRRDGRDEQRALPRRRASGKPDVRDWEPEPRRIESRARLEARARFETRRGHGTPICVGRCSWLDSGSASWSARCCRARQRRAMARWCYRRRR